MTRWAHKIELTLPATPRGAAGGVAAALASLPESFRDNPIDPLDHMIDDLREVADDETASEEDYNAALHKVYDWSDRNRLWLLLAYEETEP